MGKIVSETDQLFAQIDKISALLDTEKNALAFWPPAKVREKIERQKLWTSVGKNEEVEAVLIYGGVYPIAKIEAIITAQKVRHKGVARQLFDAFKSKLERDGYKEIQAHIAIDLPHSLKFYQSQGFEHVRYREGGEGKETKNIGTCDDIGNA